MDILLKFRCTDCNKEFVVIDEQVETEVLNCPYCNGDVDVPLDDDEEGED